MLTRRTLLAGLLLSGCTGPAPESSPAATPEPGGVSKAAPVPVDSAPLPSVTVRVMTWNIMTMGLGPDRYDPSMPREDHQWDRRAPRIAAWLSLTDPDIVGFQEGMGIQDAEGRPSNRMVGMLPDRAWANIDHFQPIMYRSTMFDCADQGVVQLYKGSAESPWDRFVSWARLVNRADGGHLFVFNTHLQPFQTDTVAKLRAATVSRLIRVMHKLNPGNRLPALLMGDFNARSDETRPVYRAHLTRLKADGWRNTEDLAGRDLSQVPGASTMNSFGGTVDGTWHYRLIRTDGGRDYDYVWVRRGTRVADWQTVTGPGVRRLTLSDGRKYPFFADGPVPSDHCPVLTRVTLKG